MRRLFIFAMSITRGKWNTLHSSFKLMPFLTLSYPQYEQQARNMIMKRSREKERKLLRNWLMWMWSSLGLKSLGQADRLKIQVRADVDTAVKFCGVASWKLRQNFYLLVLRVPSTFGEPQSLLLRPSSDWMRPAHMMENNLLYWQSSDLNVNHI